MKSLNCPPALHAISDHSAFDKQVLFCLPNMPCSDSQSYQHISGGLHKKRSWQDGQTALSMHRRNRLTRAPPLREKSAMLLRHLNPKSRSGQNRLPRSSCTPSLSEPRRLAQVRSPSLGPLLIFPCTVPLPILLQCLSKIWR